MGLFDYKCEICGESKDAMLINDFKQIAYCFDHLPEEAKSIDQSLFTEKIVDYGYQSNSGPCDVENCCSKGNV